MLAGGRVAVVCSLRLFAHRGTAWPALSGGILPVGQGRDLIFDEKVGTQ